MSRFKNPGPLMTAMLKRAGSDDRAVARQGVAELAVALTTPLRQGIPHGDVVSDIFEEIPFAPGEHVDFPLDFLVPGTEGEHVAYTIPAQGRIPERNVQGDYVSVPTYEVGSSIDLAMKYAKTARWDVVGRALEVLEASFILKNNTDGWRMLVSAGYGRNTVVYDDAVAPGFFSKRVVELGKNIMTRLAGGNTNSVNRGKLTRLYMSPEALGDIRTWDLTMVDDFTRREIFMSEDQGLAKVWGVEFRELVELGEGQEFQSYYTDRLGGLFPTYTLSGSQTKKELIVGIDTSKDDSFVRPVVQPVQLFEDPTFHRQRRISFYGWAEGGWSVLNAQRVLLLAI
jgi:hypothetical protein